MKRSEMLDALAWYLEEKYDLGYRASEQILDFLERQGMQPPPYTFKQKVVNNPTGNTISVTDYEWEFVMKVYVIVEILHSHALGTVQELVSQAFATKELARETLKMWRSTSPSEAEFDIRELELKFGEKLVATEGVKE